MTKGASIVAAGAFLASVPGGTAQGQEVLLQDREQVRFVNPWSVGDMFAPTEQLPVRIIGCDPFFERFFKDKVEEGNLRDPSAYFFRLEAPASVGYLCKSVWTKIDTPDPDSLASMKWVYNILRSPPRELNVHGLPNVFAVPDKNGILRVVSATLRGTALTQKNGWYIDVHTRASRIEFRALTQVCVACSD